MRFWEVLGPVLGSRGSGDEVRLRYSVHPGEMRWFRRDSGKGMEDHFRSS